MPSKETGLVSRQFKRNRRHQGVSLADKKRIEERRKNAMSMRMAGATLQDIVNAGIGYNNLSMVSQDLKKALNNFYQEDIESLLILDLARIDEMQKICTFVMRSKQDTSEVRNIMALMQFRRETMGVTQEQIADRRASTTSVTNNGIMVVQGNTRDYLQGLMEATGASPNEIENEFSEIGLEIRKSAGHQSLPEVVSGSSSGMRAETQAHGRVIQGEIVSEPETGATTQNGQGLSNQSSNSSSNPKTKSSPAQTPAKTGKRFKRVTKASTGDSLPGSGSHPAATQSRSQPVPVSQVALGDSILLGELVEARARQLEHDIEHMHEPGLGDLTDPAVIPVELALSQRDTETLLEVPVKLPDMNVPVSPGVVYRNPPRKLTEKEGQKVVTRRLKRPVTSSTTDKINVRVHEEEI